MNVVPINKHRPVFNSKEFRANLSESTPVNSKILQLNATDRDVGQNLYFSIHNAQSSSSLDIFSLDHETGVLSIIKSLDR